MKKRIPAIRLCLKMFAAVAALAFIAGCATYQERVYPYHKSIYSWLGAPIAQVKAAWGEPAGTDRLEGGRLAYNWLAKSGSDMCLTTLITDAKGKVVNFNPDGTSEGCAKVQPPAPRR